MAAPRLRCLPLVKKSFLQKRCRAKSHFNVNGDTQFDNDDDDDRKKLFYFPFSGESRQKLFVVVIVLETKLYFSVLQRYPIISKLCLFSRIQIKFVLHIL